MSSANGRSGLPEVWLIDLKKRAVLTHRNPVDGTYAEVGVRRRGTTISTGPPLDLELYVSSIFG